MDISVFSRCLKYLLLRNDEVVVPGLGTFTAQVVADEVDEDGNPIPPYRKISYSTVEKEDDGLFLRWIAKYLPDGTDAAQTWQDFIEDFSGELDEKKSVVIEGVGELRASARKIYYFVSDTENFEYPDVPGQESIGALLPEDYAEEESKPIELDTEKWIKQDDDTVTDAAKQPADEPVHVPEPVQEEVVPEEDDEPAPSHLSILIGNILLILFVVIIFLMIAVSLLKDLPWMSNLLDHLLYTKEELQILGK
ncbi:MAG: hypothetical protein IJS30_02835 [Bacteroidales bacterium]|nr:hypothetical protein [Bacteroidales bacterium]